MLRGDMTRRILLACVMTLMSSVAFGQTPTGSGTGAPVTQTGHELNVSLQHYDYVEPGDLNISIHGPKFGGEYTGTFALNNQRHWFAQVNLRATAGNTAYDGWCLPWQIAPSSTSPNGYRLSLGTASPCSESGDTDWYAEGRALAGKDFVGHTWSVSPFAGVGLRYLSNGTTGNPGFRTEDYLYVPLGLTVRTRMSTDRVLGLTLEYDHLIRGWQKTYDSKLGGGTVPATSTAPAFTIGDFTDFAFDQHAGRAMRASAPWQATRRWSIEPYYVRWRVNSSSVSAGSVAFTVNSVTARQTLNAFEPLNTTNEFGVKIGLRFGQR